MLEVFRNLCQLRGASLKQNFIRCFTFKDFFTLYRFTRPNLQATYEKSKLYHEDRKAGLYREEQVRISALALFRISLQFFLHNMKVNDFHETEAYSYNS